MNILEFLLTAEGARAFSYKFNFDKKINDEDKIFKFNDVKILIDQTSLNFLKGSKLDFVNDLIGSYFKIQILMPIQRVVAEPLFQYKWPLLPLGI